MNASVTGTDGIAPAAAGDGQPSSRAPPRVTRDSLCAGIMALASANWEQLHPRVGLQFIREQCLWTKSQSMDGFAAFLYFHRELEAVTVAAAPGGPMAGEAPPVAPYELLHHPRHEKVFNAAEHCKPRTVPDEATSAKV